MSKNGVHLNDRFGSTLELGVDYQIMAEFFRADYKRYGLFNIHYVPINFYYQYIFYPYPIRLESAMGGSLFLLSPLFFSVFFALWKPQEKNYIAALLASILVTNIPILLLMGTGWFHFGPRYTIDFTVPLLLLSALGINKFPVILTIFLTFISVIQYSIGMKMLF